MVTEESSIDVTHLRYLSLHCVSSESNNDINFPVLQFDEAIIRLNIGKCVFTRYVAETKNGGC